MQVFYFPIHQKEQEKQQIEEEQIEECSICLEKLEKNNSVVILECGHKFHDKCIKNWMKIKKTCPICRKKIKIKKFI